MKVDKSWCADNKISISFFESPVEDAGAIQIDCSDDASFGITYCTIDPMKFECSDPETFTITKTDTSLILECNGEEMANYVFSSGEDKCKDTYGEVEVSFIHVFISKSFGFSAPEGYRQAPGRLTAIICDNVTP